MMRFKYSIFNNRLRATDKSDILYNSFTHKSILVPRDVELIHPDQMAPQSLEAMKSWGFIVEDDINESKRVQDILLDTMSTGSIFNLIINPTLECNCRCWYCYETHHKEMVMSEVTLIHLKEFITDILSNYDELIVSFFGGEPFMEFDRIVRPIMEWTRNECKARGKRIRYGFTTNALLITQEMIEFLACFQNQKFQITLDGGRAFHNSTRVSRSCDSYAKVVAIVKKLASIGCDVLLRLNLTHENLSSAFEIPLDFEECEDEVKNHIEVGCQQVWQDIQNGDLDKDFFNLRKAFKAIGISSADKDPDSIRSTCYGDKRDSIVVNYDGGLYKCTAVDFSKTKSIGNILHGNPLKAIEEDFKHYSNRKLYKAPCQHCRIWPICAGSCYRKLSSNADHHCLFPSDEMKDEVAMNNLEEFVFINMNKNS